MVVVEHRREREEKRQGCRWDERRREDGRDTQDYMSD
jgi:hypothetical protein